MIRTQFTLDLHSEIIADNFAGGGGTSSGIELALGRPVDHAINHDAKALGMHRINHPQTVHHCEDVFDVDPRKLAGTRRVGFAWFSPDCKHFSKAKGGKPLNKKIRGLALVMFRWAEIRTRVMMMENVEEIKTWGPLLNSKQPDPRYKGRTWQAFLAALTTGCAADHPDLPEIIKLLRGTVTREQLVQGFGYQVEFKELRACDYGAPTIRKRLYLVARCDGRPIVWPSPSHARPGTNHSLRPWRAVAECIDWSLPCPSIFLRGRQALRAKCRRPLATSTLRRVAIGIGRHVIHAKKPFVISVTHQGDDRMQPISEPLRTVTGAHRGEKALVDAGLAPFISDANRPFEDRTASAADPINTICAGTKRGHFQVIAPVLAREFGQSIGQAVDSPAPTVMPHGQGKTAFVAASLTKFSTGSIGQDLRKPLPVITAGSHSKDTHGGAASVHGLVAANMIKLRGDPDTHPPAQPADAPIHTLSAAGQHHGVSMAYLAQHNGGFNKVPGHDARLPISTLSARGSQQQVVTASALQAYFGTDKTGQHPASPLRTISTKPRFGLATAEAIAPYLTPDQLAGALRVAKFLRRFGVKFGGEFATVGEYVIVDIGMRMLAARELFRAQGFPDIYVIDRAWLVNPRTGAIKEVALTKEEQIRMCGNSVCPPVATALVRANVPDLAAWGQGERHRFRNSAAPVSALRS